MTINNNICPEFSSDMVEDMVEDMAEHPPLLSKPFSFSEGITTGNNTARGVNTEDWDPSLFSASVPAANVGYTESYSQ